MTTQIAAMQWDLIKLNDLDRPALPVDFPDYRDLEVIDSEGQTLGHIVDMLINRPDRKPLLVEVLYGGFMDAGAKHVLVPFEWLHDPTEVTVKANFTRWQAESAPPYNPVQGDGLERYYYYWFPEKMPAAINLGPVTETTAEGHGPLLRIARANDWQIPEGTEDLIGRAVVNQEGEKIGVIDDWFLNVTEQRPEIVVIRRGGILGAFARESMVPYDRLERIDDSSFRARFSQEEVDAAPVLKDEIYDFGPFYTHWAAPEKLITPDNREGVNDGMSVSPLERKTETSGS